MISILSSKVVPSKIVDGVRKSRELFTLAGLSTDTKPVTEYKGILIRNGSTFIEIDTGKEYLYDEAGGEWHEQPEGDKKKDDPTAEEISVSRGSADAGKVIVVGNDGKLLPVDLEVGEGQIALDGTLSVSGAAADAKKTGDAIASLNGSLGTFAEKIFSKENKTGQLFRLDTPVTLAEITAENYPVTVEHYGKNLLAYPYYTGAKTIEGVTFTPQPDGSIKVVGTATKLVSYPIVTDITTGRRNIKAGTYTLSGCPIGGSSNTYNLWANGLGLGFVTDNGNGVTFTINEDKTFYLKISVYAGQSVDATFYPMIELGSEKTEWQKYQHDTIAAETKRTIDTFIGTNTFSSNTDIAISYLSTKQDKNSINVKDFGVVGDGLTDDTNAINDAFVAAEGKTIQFPSGTYKFSGTLVIPSNTHVIGAGQSTVFKLADTFTLSSIRHREDQDLYKYPMMRLADGAVSCTLEHFKIKGQTVAFKDEPEVGLLIVGNDHIVNDVIVEDANFFPDDFAGRTSNAPAWGFMVFNAEHIRVTNCKGINCGYEAFGTEATTDCLIDNFEAGFCNQTCLQVHRNSYDITFNSCAVRYELPEGAAVRPAFTMHGGSDEYDLDGIKISDCNFYGGITFIGGYENGILIIGNIATGGITMNGTINRKNIFIIGNRLNGGISGRYKNAVIVGNMATNNTGGRFITVSGENIICAHNIPLGTGKYVAVNDVAVEQWVSNSPLS